MSVDPDPRFVCLHYREEQGNYPSPARSFVLDRWYSHEHVAVFTQALRWDISTHSRHYLSAREQAERKAAALNAEHVAWLAADA